MKKLYTFKHGVHPAQHKAATENNKIIPITPKEGEIFTFSLQQHIGAAAVPIVEKGERVLAGQMIAEAPSPVSSPVHASISGVIKDFAKDVIAPNGSTCDAILLENDGLFEEVEYSGANEDFLTIPRQEVLDRIQAAGVVGLGGAGFPTHVKLAPLGRHVDYVIINAAECEPYLTTDYRIMVEHPNYIKRGLQILSRIFSSCKIIIGIEGNKTEAVTKMKEITKYEHRMTVMELAPKYPQGSEKQIIEACTGRQVPSGGLPLDVRCLVENVSTLAAMERAVYRGRPLMRRVVTLSGGAFNQPGNYEVRLGMNYRSMIDAAGGFAEEPAKIITGGPMMGAAMYSLDVPLTKTCGAVLAFTAREAKMLQERPCIRCGRCANHCPMSLLPLELNSYAISGKIDEFIKLHGKDCIECGTCSYVCPSKRHLTQSFRMVKRSILK